jgi:hypothetical protein
LNIFYAYFQLGLEHISDFNGYDHILYLLVLSAIFPLQEWKKILLLVTAFTIGHSISLACAVLKLIQINSAFVEVLIPLTILLTCLWNLYQIKNVKNQTKRTPYLLTIVFGVIHGLGFSNFFSAIFTEELGAALPLLSFNIGLELGQLLIVVFFLLVKYILSLFSKFSHAEWVIFFSGIGFGLSLLMIIERIKLI